VSVLLESTKEWDTPAGRRVVDHFSRGFSYLPNVHEVRSLTQPFGKPVEEPPELPVMKSKSLRGSLLNAFVRGVVNSVSGQIGKASRAFYQGKIVSVN
jgi:hypothetical protein